MIRLMKKHPLHSLFRHVRIILFRLKTLWLMHRHSTKQTFPLKCISMKRDITVFRLQTELFIPKQRQTTVHISEDGLICVQHGFQKDLNNIYDKSPGRFSSGAFVILHKLYLYQNSEVRFLQCKASQYRRRKSFFRALCVQYECCFRD